MPDVAVFFRPRVRRHQLRLDEVAAFFIVLGALVAGFLFLVYLDIKWFPDLVRSHVRFFRPRQ